MQTTSQYLNVVLAQMCSSDEPGANLEQIKQLLEQSESFESDLICFPENSLFMRVSSKDPSKAFSLEDEIFRWLSDWSQSRKVHVLLGSIPLKENEGVSNATILFSPEHPPKPVYRKIHLFDVDVEGEAPQRESDQFVHGSRPAVINVKGWSLGLSICYDLRFSELYQSYARRGVEVILVPSAFLVPTGQAHWETLLRARAIESQAYVLAAAQAGKHKGGSGSVRHSYGHSMVIDPWGKILAELDGEQVALVQVRLDKEMLNKVRRQIPMAQHRRMGPSTNA